VRENPFTGELNTSLDMTAWIVLDKGRYPMRKDTDIIINLPIAKYSS
jgi:hypothetical protein